MNKAPHILLAIESSCDETAVAILKDGETVLASEIASQVEEHARFGGVVPEIASRQHLAALFPLIELALSQAGLALADLDAIAVTRAPGLIGALLVGVSAAKSLAYGLNIPLVPVNHLEAHLLAALLTKPAPTFPFLGQIISGGHTALYRVERPGAYELLGNTRDDAAGEAYDKVAKMLGLGYPGGVVIDHLARSGNPAAIEFPRAMKGKQTLDFSFSGIKTAVRTHIEAHPPTEAELPDLCASFQEAVVDSLINKALQALKQTGLTRWVMGGGVAANSRLREKAALMAKRRRVELYLPERAMCTDNAAMVAVAGWHRLKAGALADLTLNAAANEHIF
jgi:N6-L-threonylcarbamoyladenine synthase